MKTYFQPLIDEYSKLAVPERAAKAKAYMRNKFPFLGLEARVRRSAMQKFLKEHGLPVHGDLQAACEYLWALPEREYQQTAVDILEKRKKELRKEDIYWIEGLISRKSWWDTVDGLAAWIVGYYFKLYPNNIVKVTEKWMTSENIWLQRTCLLFQLKYKDDTDTQLLADLIRRLSAHPDFFIRKAIGWVLREYSKTDPAWVRDFIQKNELSPLSRREGSKYLV